MCGITGIIYHDKNAECDATLVRGMRDLQIHRGPDSAGVFVHKNIGLGHRRLSIIDLSKGHQPMENDDGTIVIVYNGEIYNYKEIRKKLIDQGCRFKTDCDTEVILRLYEAEGEKCVLSLNGMFAFAIWDSTKNAVFIARDRMGIKPVYYASTPEYCIFSSEIKSFFYDGLLKAECNDAAILEYFMFRDVAGEQTLYAKIQRLLPGHTLTIKDGKITTHQYWSIYSTATSFLNHSFAEASERLIALLEDAVKIRLMSDVPLGTFCSGGVDSSLVTAIAAQNASEPLNTFSVGFHEQGYDETPFARMVSEKYTTIHHEVRLSNDEFAELLPKLIWHNDEPLNFANSVQMYAISKLAKEFVTVVLTGEGADELFGGYPRYYIPKFISKINTLPWFLRNAMLSIAAIPGDHRIEKLRQASTYNANELILYNSAFLHKDYLLSTLENISEPFDFVFRQGCLQQGDSRELGQSRNLSLLDQHNYLVSILYRQDKMSMAASIESRVPFLDYRIVEFANCLQPWMKNRNFQTKYIVKKVAEKFLPKEVVYRKKSGFGVPLSQWLSTDHGLGEVADSIGGSSQFPAFLSQKKYRMLLNEHRAGRKDHSDLLWATINFCLWKQIFHA